MKKVKTFFDCRLKSDLRTRTLDLRAKSFLRRSGSTVESEVVLSLTEKSTDTVFLLAIPFLAKGTREMSDITSAVNVVSRIIDAIGKAKQNSNRGDS